MEEGLGRTDLRFIPMDPEQRASKLDLTDWSNELEWKVIQTISRYMNAYQVHKGGVLFREFSKEAFMCVILSGSVRVVKETSGGKPKVLRRFGAGRVIGEMSLMDGEPRSASLLAAKDTTVLIFTPKDLQKLSQMRPEVAIAFISRIAKEISIRLRQTSGILVDYVE